MNARIASQAYTFRPCKMADQQLLVDLFNKAYSGCDATFVPRTLRHWQWKYAEHPLGCRSLLAICNETGAIVGHIGGIPYRTCRDGIEYTTLQTADHMIDPDHRRGLQRRGLFADLMLAWIGTYCGPRAGIIGWGFPSRANFRIGEKFCRYYSIHRARALVHRSLAPCSDSRPGIRIERQNAFSREINDLWKRCCRELRLANARTKEYLDWRYARHPEIDYSAHEARDASSGVLRGLAVTRCGGLAQDTLTIMDWLVPSGDEEARGSLLASIRRSAGDQGLGAVLAWFPEATREHTLFVLEGFRPYATAIRMAACTYLPGLTIDELRSSYYLTFGDIDYL